MDTRVEKCNFPFLLACFALGAVACGGSHAAEPKTSAGVVGQKPASATVRPALTILRDMAACEPSGRGTDYQVGPGKEFTSLTQVPWENLGPGDTVRIFYSATPYKGKFLLAAQGTANAPVRVCGVRGPNNERPIIEGNGAVSRTQLASAYGNSTEVSHIHQARSIVVFKQKATEGWTAKPSHIQLDGLAIRGAHPNYTFTDASGQTRKYDKFGACIWVDRGHNITIADNEVSDCQMAIFSKSTDDGDFALTRNLRVAGNYFHNNGIVNSWFEHTTYLQSVGLLLEFNRFGPMRSGATGNQHKDRSVGSVIRYNYIEGGAHSLDLVEAEDNPTAAGSDPAYRTTFVYGNHLINGANSRAIVHYGGDHFGSTPGSHWGEPLFRKGTLYFFNNTVIGTGAIRLFRVSTTEEKVEAWNNIFWSSSSILVRETENDSVGAAWTPNGPINLGVNWMRSGYGGANTRVVGTANVRTGSVSPIDLSARIPVAGSAVIDRGVAGPPGASAHPVKGQLSASFAAGDRTVTGAAIDLGAFERP